MNPSSCRLNGNARHSQLLVTVTKLILAWSVRPAFMKLHINELDLLQVSQTDFHEPAIKIFLLEQVYHKLKCDNGLL